MAKDTSRSTWGSKRKRGKASWELRFTVGGQPKTETFHGTEKAADRRLAELRIQYEGKEAETTLNTFWKTIYLPEAQDRLALKTWTEYERYYDREIYPVFGEMFLGDITARQLQKWLEPMTNGKAKHAKQVISAILSRAMALDYVEDNVAQRRFILPKTKADTGQRSKDTFSGEEMKEILEEIRGEIFEAMYILAAGGGAIRGEAAAPMVRPNEIAFSGNYAIVEMKRSIQRVRGKVEIVEHVKNEYREDPLIVLPPFSLRLEEIVFEARNRGDIWLTDDGFGYPQCPERMVKAYERWFQRSGHKYVPFSNLRNSFSRWLHSMEIEDSTISKLMRHSNLNTDYKHYNRITPNEKIAILDDAMGNYGQSS